MTSKVTMTPRRVHMMHLDLGIGGAEQLVVNIPCMLKDSGHQVTIFTTHHDINHCFEETKPDGKIGSDIKVFCDWLPRNVLGKFTAFFAILRMIFLAFIVGIFYKNQCDLVILDGVSAPIPFLRFFGIKVIFYCHFPDLLLCTERGSTLKRIYRSIVDKFEEITTDQANLILVNSEFTAGVFEETFPAIAKHHKPAVLYPVIKDVQDATILPIDNIAYCKGYDTVFVSLNRYEMKKKIEIALGAMQLFLATNRGSSAVLVVAGGYDTAVAENVEYLKALQKRCDVLGLRHTYLASNAEVTGQKYDVIFRTSISSQERTALFQHAKGLLYTPDREHFGIVPLESMQMGLPVIAVNSGGPTETIAHRQTGFLCKQTAEDFGTAMVDLVQKEGGTTLYERMSEAAKLRVKTKFSESAMKKQLNDFVQQVVTSS